ncbi:putative soyasaponin III rhamnosyltransferase [Helianthus anomalus]
MTLGPVSSPTRRPCIPYLKRAFGGLQPDDFAPYWLPSVAAGLEISRAFFSIINAWFISFQGPSPDDLINGSEERTIANDFLAPPKWVPFPSKLCYRKHEASWMVGNISVNASGVSDGYRGGMFEPQWLTLLEKLLKLPVIPVGLMPPVIPTHVGDEKDATWVTIKKWLDRQQNGRVVYVALGSEVMLSKSELAELALGLELSGLPFFWALRKPLGSTESNSIELPDGFLERTRDRGVVWTSWVPQLQVGIKVPRNEEDGSFTKESIARSLKSVVGKIYKANPMELSQIFSNTNMEKRYINNFIDYLEKTRGVVAINNET